nr:hypothetical protein [Tanacetum cinerariifolium]
MDVNQYIRVPNGFVSLMASGLHSSDSSMNIECDKHYYASNNISNSQNLRVSRHHPPPQETSIEILHDQENENNSAKTFLRKYNRYSFFETPKVLLLAWDRVFKIKDALGNKQYKPDDTQELFRKLFNDVQNIHEELAEYINTSGWNRPAFYNNGDDDDEDGTIAITSDFLITDSLSMGDEHLDTIPEKESDEFNKSSVEDLVPNPSEFEDECKWDVPDCDDSQTTNFSTFSNPLFDDSTSSDDESSHEEVIHKMSFKTYSNPLFYLDEEIISSGFNPIHNEDLDFTPKIDRFDTKFYLLESLLKRDESIPPGIDCDDSDSEGENLFLERLLHDDPIPLPDTLDFSNVIRVFLPFFTYPVTSSILLSSGSEDTIFDLGISNYHFSSLELGVSHRSGTFMKFNYSRKYEDSCQSILSSKSSFPQLQLGINLLHLAGSQPMLKSSYKAEDGVIISIPPLVGGVAGVVVEIKGIGWNISITSRFSVGLQTPDDLSRSRLGFIEKMGVHG